jgi:hypothetical protein
MSARTTRWRPFALFTLVAAIVFAFALTSQVGAGVAQTSDTAGSAYATAIAKAKEKRAAKLKKCNMKPTKAKRAACKKAANRAYQTAKEAAQEKRDSGPSGDGGPPSSPVEEYRDCLDGGGDPRECKEEAKEGGK